MHDHEPSFIPPVARMWAADFNDGYNMACRLAGNNYQQTYRLTAPDTQLAYRVAGHYTAASYVETPEFGEIERQTPTQHRKKVRRYLEKIDEIRREQPFMCRWLFQLGFYVGQLDNLGMRIRSTQIAAFIDRHRLDRLDAMVDLNLPDYMVGLHNERVLR